ncbi:unnamed protein product [Sphagnum jensenii]|uniref:Uncharacterized protein n=1 Tax=Sphagnum jensenii TaxID=128206 RepID=A0ABP0X941_9BRYO
MESVFSHQQQQQQQLLRHVPKPVSKFLSSLRLAGPRGNDVVLQQQQRRDGRHRGIVGKDFTLVCERERNQGGQGRMGEVEENEWEGSTRLVTRNWQCMRRSMLISIGSWPLLLITTASAGRQAAAARSASDIDEDPIEMAVVAALDAQEMLPALSRLIVQAKSTPGLTDECQTPLRKWNLIYERLELGVFKLAEELDVDTDTVEQLLEGLLYVEEDLCNHGSIYARKGQSLGTQRNDLKRSLQSLKLAQNQLELLLQKVPIQLLEVAQLARGVRPMA